MRKGRKETLTFAKFIASTANPMSSTRLSTKQDMIVNLFAQLVPRALSTTERETIDKTRNRRNDLYTKLTTIVNGHVRQDVRKL